MFDTLRSLTKGLFRRGRLELDMDEEMRGHLAARARDLERAGLDPESAYRQARLEFGSMDGFKESCRQARGLRLLDESRTLLRYSLRSLRRTPFAAGFAILALGLGIGAGTAIYSVVRSVLLQPLPFPDSGRIVMIWETNPAGGFMRNTPAPANWTDWQAQSTAFSAIAAMRGRAGIAGPDAPEELQGRGVTANFFDLMGVKPQLGRVFTAAEDHPDPDVVVISHALWARRFQSDPGVAGTSLALNGVSYTIVGVMPDSFVFPNPETAFWMPAGFTAAEAATRDSYYLQVVARLAPGRGLDEAQAELNTIMRRLERTYPASNTGRGASVVPLQADIAREARPILLLLSIVSLLVLLIACTNVSGILLARAANRSHEYAVQLALGAGSWRIVAALVCESLLLMTTACAAGVMVAKLTLPLFARLVPGPFHEWMQPRVDAGAVGIGVALALAASLLVVAPPALQVLRGDLGDRIKTGARSSTGRGGRARTTLIVAEIALSTVLIFTAGLLLKSVLRIADEPLGFDTVSVLTLRTRLPSPKYDDAGSRTQFFDRVEERVRALPEVADAGYTSTLPFQSVGNTSTFLVEGRRPFLPGEESDALTRVVTPGYLRVMRFELLEGRLLLPSDRAGAVDVVVINESFARRYYEGSPIGKRIKVAGTGETAPWRQIVGVVRDVKERGYDLAMKPGVYLSAYQVPSWVPASLAVRFSEGMEISVKPVVAAIREIDPEQPVSSIQTMADIVSGPVLGRKSLTSLAVAFGALSVVLAALGLYAVLAFRVSLRRREIGLRMALGASASRVSSEIVRNALGLTLAGIGVGLVASAGLGPALEQVLYKLSPFDPSLYAQVAGGFVIVAVLAAWLPARQAARVDPMTALRGE